MRDSQRKEHDEDDEQMSSITKRRANWTALGSGMGKYDQRDPLNLMEDCRIFGALQDNDSALDLDAIDYESVWSEWHYTRDTVHLPPTIPAPWLLADPRLFRPYQRL